jgi:hypothetical protein
MLKHLLFVAAIFLASCADTRFEPSLSQEIEGEWANAEHPTRHYIFGEGYCTAWEYNFSTVINAHWYRTEQTGERDLMLIEINKKDTLYWKFSETDGQTVTVADGTNAPTFYFNLKSE